MQHTTTPKISSAKISLVSSDTSENQAFAAAQKTGDNFWQTVRQEAETLCAQEPLLATFILSTILNQETLENAIIARIAARLDHPTLPAELLAQTFQSIIAQKPSMGEAFLADLSAVQERDPACTRLIEPILYFKGFHALQTHRFAHILWQQGRKDVALYLQSRSSEVFQTDIHPAAPIGKGVFLDHATGLVVGATAVIEHNVSILHNVTLGGTGKERGDRHPKIRQGVMIGAGAKILGNIEVGKCSRIAAGSVVLSSVPPHKTVAGVPAKIIGDSGCMEPCRSMDQHFADCI
jgi:serine O-acetyltransferase